MEPVGLGGRGAAQRALTGLPVDSHERSTSKVFTVAELAACCAGHARLPIACVEGWSAEAEWTGVVLGDLVAAVGGSAGADVRMISL